jgi:Domain of unknown function (DUF4129)
VHLRSGGGQRIRPQPLPTRSATLPPAPAQAHSHTAANFPLAAVLYGLLIVILLAAIAGCVVLARRRRAWLAGQVDADFYDEPDEMRAAVESGRTALRRLDDARAAIIACYAAMEHSLAKAGTARAVAETPDELLTRAVASGLARGSAAARLTEIFYEARFSSHPMDRGQRDAAEGALGEIAADLGRPAAGTATPEDATVSQP